MKRAVTWALVLVTGVSVGFTIRAWSEPSRSDYILTTLSHVCMPHVAGERPDLRGLKPIRLFHGEEHYGHNRALLLVALEGTECTISDDPKPLAAQDREALTVGVRHWVSTHFPDLPENDLASEVNWEQFLFFGIQNDRTPGSFSLFLINPTPPSSERRWATSVSLSRIPPREEEI